MPVDVVCELPIVGRHWQHAHSYPLVVNVVGLQCCIEVDGDDHIVRGGDVVDDALQPAHRVVGLGESSFDWGMQVLTRPSASPSCQIRTSTFDASVRLWAIGAQCCVNSAMVGVPLAVILGV